MSADLSVAYLVGFLLALVRTASWMLVSPPFNSKMIPRLVKLGTAVAISLVLAPKLPVDQVTLDTSTLLGLILLQIVTGLILGFLTQILFAAVQAAGSLIDLFGGFTLSQAFDPFMNSQSSVFGRFYGMLAVVLLFAINGHLMIIKGFMTSFDAVPLDGPALDDFKQLLVHNLSSFVLAAAEIAGPLLAAYFLAEVALGLLSKAAPQLNVITIGFPFKILLTLLMISWALPMVPGALDSLVDDMVRSGVGILRSGNAAAAANGGG